MSHEITQVDDDLVDLVEKCLHSKVNPRFIKVDGVFMPEYYLKFTDAIEDFEVRDDDVWVCSFPKTGTTWTQEMVWCIANDLDFEGAKESINVRFPFLELSSMMDLTAIAEDNPDMKFPETMTDSISIVERLPSPRFIKTHLPFNLLPRQLRTGEKKAKIVYVARNAKDTCISYYHHSKIFQRFPGTFEDFCNLFIRDSVTWAPFWKHVLGFWKNRIDENLLFLRFEDMKKDLPWVLNKTAKFLGKNLTTDQLSTLTEHLSFASMQSNPAVNHEEELEGASRILGLEREEGEKFIRSGNTDQWKTDMSPEDIERFDNWTRENLEGTRLYY